MEKVILFGMGKYFQTKEKIFERYEVVAILDSSINVRAEYDDKGITIINPRELHDGQEKIFLMSMHFISMWKQLVDLGVNPKRLVYPFFEKPYFQSDAIVDKYVSSINFYTKFFSVHFRDGREKDISSQSEWNELLREIYQEEFNIIDSIVNASVLPISRQFATERGTPVDRYYIDDFLQENSKYIVNSAQKLH